MEELLGSLESSLTVKFDPLSTSKQHPRFSQFKQKTHKISQEERRRVTLETQKRRRYDYQSHVRRLAESDFHISENESESDCEEMEWIPPKIKTPRTYKDQIMLSEWLVDVPSDFSETWLMVLCPIGKRCLIVSSGWRAKVFSRSGYKITEFRCALPGSCIIDCLWNEVKQLYYVLDVICWNGVPLLGCEAEFRFSWLQSKFDEDPELEKKSQKNRYPFCRLPFVSCTPENIHKSLEECGQVDWKFLDGLLFYHKLAFYAPGTTPLVGWLKPFMVPEILNIPVPEVFQHKKPAGYTNIQQHIHKKPKDKVVDNLMEV